MHQLEAKPKKKTKLKNTHRFWANLLIFMDPFELPSPCL